MNYFQMLDVAGSMGGKFPALSKFTPGSDQQDRSSISLTLPNDSVILESLCGVAPGVCSGALIDGEVNEDIAVSSPDPAD